MCRIKEEVERCKLSQIHGELGVRGTERQKLVKVSLLDKDGNCSREKFTCKGRGNEIGSVRNKPEN